MSQLALGSPGAVSNARWNPLRPQHDEPRQAVWFRLLGRIPDDDAVHRALLAYASDFHLLGTATFPHGISYYQPNVQMASLDHALWFHRPFRADEWLLYVSDSPSAFGARGFVRGQVFVEAGDLSRRQAEQWRGQRRAQAGVVGRAHQRFEQPAQLARLRAGVQALAAGADAGDAERGQRALQRQGVGVAADQHADVGRQHGALDAMAVHQSRTTVEQCMDLRRARAHGLGAKPVHAFLPRLRRQRFIHEFGHVARVVERARVRVAQRRLHARMRTRLARLDADRRGRNPHGAARELSDALRRRCLYHWLEYPSAARAVGASAAADPLALRGLRHLGVGEEQAVAAVLAQIESPVLPVGHSYGGAVALEIALRWPEKELVSVVAHATYAEPARPFLAPEDAAEDRVERSPPARARALLDFGAVLAATLDAHDAVVLPNEPRDAEGFAKLGSGAARG